MKIFAVRDEDNTTNKAVAYLFYYEKEKRFYIELPEDADPWETPLILSSFLKKGKKQLTLIGAEFGCSRELCRLTDRILA